MNNTIILKAKGIKGLLLFNSLRRVYPGTLKVYPPQWWQLDNRYEMRIQNMPYAELQELKASLALQYFDVKVDVL